jgi:hypothetical protein
MDEGDHPNAGLTPAERSRARRRERERTAKDRELMRTGQAKAFKQILDAQARRAAEAGPRPEPPGDRSRSKQAGQKGHARSAPGASRDRPSDGDGDRDPASG